MPPSSFATSSADIFMSRSMESSISIRSLEMILEVIIFDVSTTYFAKRASMSFISWRVPMIPQVQSPFANRSARRAFACASVCAYPYSIPALVKNLMTYSICIHYHNHSTAQ